MVFINVRKFLFYKFVKTRFKSNTWQQKRNIYVHLIDGSFNWKSIFTRGRKHGSQIKYNFCLLMPKFEWTLKEENMHMLLVK